MESLDDDEDEDVMSERDFLLAGLGMAHVAMTVLEWAPLLCVSFVGFALMGVRDLALASGWPDALASSVLAVSAGVLLWRLVALWMLFGAWLQGWRRMALVWMMMLRKMERGEDKDNGV